MNPRPRVLQLDLIVARISTALYSRPTASDPDPPYETRAEVELSMMQQVPGQRDSGLLRLYGVAPGEVERMGFAPGGGYRVLVLPVEDGAGPSEEPTLREAADMVHRCRRGGERYDSDVHTEYRVAQLVATVQLALAEWWRAGFRAGVQR
jgi:hypothetical protein